MSSKAVYNSLQEMHVVISASELLHKEDIKSILIGYFHLRGCFFTNNFHRCRLESSGQLFNFFQIIFKSKKKTERIFFPARVTSVFLLEIFIFLSYLGLTRPPVRPQERQDHPLTCGTLQAYPLTPQNLLPMPISSRGPIQYQFGLV